MAKSIKTLYPLDEKEMNLLCKNTDADELTRQIGEMKEEISAFQKIIVSMQSHMSEIKKEISSLKVQNDYLTAKYKDYEKKEIMIQNKIEKTKGDINFPKLGVRMCLGCMSRIEETKKVCSICGFHRDTVQNAPFMPLGTELQEGNYIVGRKLSNNAEGAKYIGYSETMETTVVISEFMPAGICGRANGKKKLVIRSGCEDQYQQLKIEFLSYYRNIARQRELTSIDPIFDIFIENDVPYTVSEYYASIPFIEYINCRGGRIGWGAARPLFMPLITDLSTLHAFGIGHYAISPKNLVVTSFGKLRLTDFALKEFRQTGSFFTPELMDGCAAPEQYKENGVLDEATDVYGFTATLLYALTGRLPENSNERRADGKFSIPTVIYNKLPPHVVSALANGLQVNKLMRITMFNDMMERLLSDISMADNPSVNKNDTGKKRHLFGWFS